MAATVVTMSERLVGPAIDYQLVLAIAGTVALRLSSLQKIRIKLGGK